MQKRTYQVGDQVYVSIGFGDVRAVAVVIEAKMVTVKKSIGNGHRADFEEQQLLCGLTLPRATKETRFPIMAKQVVLMCAVENRMDIKQEFVEGGKTDAND